MARTRAAVRQAVAANCRDLLIGTVSAVNGQTISVPEIAHLSADVLNGSEVYVYSGTGSGQARVIRTHAQNTTTGVGTLLPFVNWTTPPDTTSLVEISLREHGLTVATKNEAIRQAHAALEDVYLTDVVDTSLVMEAGRHDYPIPSGFRYLGRVEMDWPTDVGVPGSVYDSGALNWGAPFYDQDRGLASASSQQKLAQGFRVTAGGNPNGYWMGGVALYLRTVGTPTGTLTARVETDAGGLPTGTLLDANGMASVAVSGVSSTYAYVVFRFAAPVFCTSGVQLNIVLSTSGSVDAANYVAWGEDTATTYARGNAATYNGATWSAVSGSAFLFAVQSSQINERFVALRDDTPGGPSWDVVRSSSLLWIADPVESARLRLTGQGNAVAPTTDAGAVTIPEAYLIPKATALLLASQGAGPQTDADARDRWALFYEKKAEAELVRCRVQPRPGARPVTPR